MAYFVDHYDNGFKYRRKKPPVKQGATLEKILYQIKYRNLIQVNQGKPGQRVSLPWHGRQGWSCTQGSQP